MGDVLAQPHHDGSEAHLEPPVDLGDETTVLLYVGRFTEVKRVPLLWT